MERYFALGFSDSKMNVGASLDVDFQRVRAAREVLGPQRRLALDSNNGYKSLPEALRAARAFQPFDPWRFFNPTPAFWVESANGRGSACRRDV